MTINTREFNVILFCLLMGVSSIARATIIDFSTDEDGTPLLNGQDISSPDEFGINVSVKGVSHMLGAAIFDSDPNGPNQGLRSDDMLVDKGNLLIIQNPNFADQTIPGIYDEPTESTLGGTFVFEFTKPSRLNSIDLIDIDDVGGSTAVMTDTQGLQRTYVVEQGWTFDLAKQGPLGYGTLDLTTLALQPGEGVGSATATEDAGFNPSAVSKFEVTIFRSGGIDNLNFVVPEPTQPAIGLLIFSIMVCWRRRVAK